MLNTKIQAAYTIAYCKNAPRPAFRNRILIFLSLNFLGPIWSEAVMFYSKSIPFCSLVLPV